MHALFTRSGIQGSQFVGDIRSITEFVGLTCLALVVNRASALLILSSEENRMDEFYEHVLKKG